MTPLRVDLRPIDPRSRNRVAYVREPGDDWQTRVRWQYARPEMWRCDECGAMAEATCPHTFAVALVLAEQILGLTRAEAQPTQEEA